MAKVPTGQQMRSAERLLQVLASFTADTSTRSIADIGRDLDLSMTTVRRLLQTLHAHGFLSHDAARGTYVLGHEVIRLASVALTGSSLITISGPYLDELNRRLNETVQFTIRDGRDLIVIDFRQSSHIIKAFHTVGHRYPAYKGGAAGLALLMDLSAAQLQATLPADADWPEGPEAGPKSLAELLPLLAEARRAGYGTNDAYTNAGVWAVAAPVRNTAGEAIAAVNVPCPATRTQSAERRAEIVAALLECTTKINEAAVFIR